MRYVRQVAGVVILVGTLSLGLAQQATASSANVAALQVALKAIGLYPVAVDGVKGPFTERGVRSLQQRRRLLVDGVPGPQTRHALGRRGRPRLGSRVMHSGQRGWDVAALQFLLQRRGYAPGGVDGGFGPGTRSALVAYQRAAGLTVDGLAGSATISALRQRSGGPTRTPTGPVSFYRPAPGPIGDHFGAPRENGRKHSGIDFPVAYGTLVEAAGVGTTVFAGYNSGGYGNLVVVQHRLGYTTWYAHLSRVTSWSGEHVEGGTRLGYVGSTGHSTGPHLHFEVRLNNVPIDPLPYLLAGTAARAQSGVTVHASCADPAAYRTASIDDCR
ncbi:MAG: peptidoglycan-binding protein [Thermoleophilaceae bacterium]|nr:peptidoglycan-binding protein [Thermoleophilaceae bacterium]